MKEKDELKLRGEILNLTWVGILQLEKSGLGFSLLVKRRQRREEKSVFSGVGGRE